MANADVAWVDVLPSMRQFGPTMDRALAGTMAAAGVKGGNDYAAGFSRAAVPAMNATSAKLAAARNKEADAAGALRVAELKLQETRDNGNAKASQIAAAEERLEKARRAVTTASENTSRATSALSASNDKAAQAARNAATGHDEADRSAGRLSRTYGSLVGIAAGVGTAFYAVRSAFSVVSSSIGAASDLNETMNKATTIFGANSAAVTAWAQNSAKSLGMAKGAALESAAGFGNMFSQLGFTGSEAAKMSMSVVQMSADLGSFNNLPTGDVAERISAAFRGEYDSLQMLIPNISAARVESEAMAATGKTNADSLTAQEKAAAVLAIVQRDGAAAMGDFAKTSDGLANSQKILNAQWGDAKAALGQSLMPVMTTFVQFLSASVMPKVMEFATVGLPRMVDWLGRMGQGFAGVYAIIAQGDFAGASKTFGWAEDSRPVDYLFRVRDILVGLKDLVTGGDWRSSFMSAGIPPSVTSGIASFRDTITSINWGGFVQGFRDSSGAAGPLSGFLSGLKTHTGEFGSALGSIVAGALPLIVVLLRSFGDIVGFLGDHTGLLTAGIVALAAGFAIYRTSQVAANIAQAASIPLRGAEVVANLALASSQRALALQLSVLTGVQTTSRFSWIASTASVIANTIATAASAVAQGTIRAATAAWTGAQWLLNAALSANPIGIVIALLVALGAGLVIAWKHSETFRDVVLGVWQKVQDGASWMWNNVLKPVFGWVMAGWDALASGVQWAYQNVVQPTWNALQSAADFLWNRVLAVYFAAIAAGWSALATGVQWAYNNVVQPTWNALQAAADFLWNRVLMVYFQAIGAGWSALATGVHWAYNNVVQPTWSALQSAAEWMWTRVLQPTFSAISSAWSGLSTGIQWAYNNIVAPIWTFFGNAVSGLQTIFESSVSAIKTAWDKLQEIAKAPVRFVVNTVINDGLISAFNSVVGWFGLDSWKVSKVQLPAGFSKGGEVPAYADGGRIGGFSPTPTSDNIPGVVNGRSPIRVNAGEWIHPVDSVRRYGDRFMSDVQTGRFPAALARYYSEGGMVPAYASGGELFATVKGAFPRAKANSMGRPGDPGYHGKGMAVDLGEEGFSGGAGRPYLAAMKRWLVDNYGRASEIIYNGLGNDRTNIKNGAPLAYSAAIQAQHRNHVHLAHAGSMASARGGPGGAPSVAPGGGGGSEDPSMLDFLRGPKAWLTSKVSGLLGGIGTSGKFVGFLKDVPGRLIEAGYSTIKDKIGGWASSLVDGAKDAASGAWNFVTGLFGDSGGDTKRAVQGVFGQKGWGSGAQWDAADWIIGKESGWNPRAQNPSSTASGLFQHIDATWRANRPSNAGQYAHMKDAPIEAQAAAGGKYIGGRYGSPIAAKAFWEKNRHYSLGGQIANLFDKGGIWKHGRVGVNMSGRDERVLTAPQDTYFRRFVEWADRHTESGGGRKVAETINIHANDRDQGQDIVDKLWHKVRVADAGGVYSSQTFTG